MGANSWSYSGNPLANAKDALRFTVGDTDESEPQLTDGEIEYLLSIYNQVVLNASIRACEMLMAKYARLVNETVGSVKVDWSTRQAQYREMRDDLTMRLAKEDCTPFAGGISVTQKITEAQNTDRVKPDFTKHMMENERIAPWVTGQNVTGNCGSGDND